VLYQVTGPPNATADQMLRYTNQVFQAAAQIPEYEQAFQLSGVPTVNQGFGGILLKTWDERTRGATAVQQYLQNQWNGIAGGRVVAFQFPALPGSQGLPVQFVINTTEPFANLNEVAQAVLDDARKSGKFFFIDGDLKIDKPQSTLVVDRDLIANLGLTEGDVGAALSGALGGNYVNYFSISGRSYRVIPQVLQTDRLNPARVLDYQIRTPSGSTIPVSTVAHFETKVVPETVTHFQQLNSVTLGGVNAAPQGVTQGDALQFLRDSVAKHAPSGYSVDYSGESRQYMKESSGFAITLAFSIIIVFLALSAQFESFRDPVVILISVPLALFGALIYVNLWSTLNIYSQVGLVTLTGLISKHGILIVQFANDLQRSGHGKIEAVIEGAGVRLRPILMTTAAMVLGVFPLAIASGAGAAGRQTMGWVVASGLSVGTLFTLFVVPAMYVWLAKDHSRERSTGSAGEYADAQKPA